MLKILYERIDKLNKMAPIWYPDYICLNSKAGEYYRDGEKQIQYISNAELIKLSSEHKDLVVIIGCQTKENIDKAISLCQEMKCEYKLIDDVIFKAYSISFQEVVEKYNGNYIDDFGNQIQIGPTTQIPNGKVNFSTLHTKEKAVYDNYINLDKNVTAKNLLIDVRSSKNIVSIEENTRIIGCVIIISEKNRVKIGKDCLFARDNEIRASNSHPIFDLDTHKRTNVKRDVIIGNHVWVGEDCKFFPGTRISDGSIVGASTNMSHDFADKNIIIAGSPAKCIRKNVIWAKDTQDMDDIEDFSQCNDHSALKYI